MSIKIKLDDIPWIKSIPEDIRYAELLKIISLGRNIIEFTQVSINPECSIFNPIYNKISNLEKDSIQSRKIEEQKFENTRIQLNSEIQKISSIYESIIDEHEQHKENMVDISTSIMAFTKNSNVSSIKGKITENIVETIISNFFKEDIIEDTSKQNMAGDYQIQCKEGYQILVEVKNYKTPVDQSQVDKFIRDIKHNKMSGIFISTTSRIVKKNILEIQELDSGEILIYISDCGITGEYIILSVLLLKELIKKKNINISNLDVDVILENVEKFSDICNLVCGLNKSIYNIKNQINDSLQNLYNDSYKCEVEIFNLFNNIKYEITNELIKIDNSIDEYENIDKLNFIKELKIENPKISDKLDILSKLENCNIIKKNNKLFIINKNSEIISEIKKLKTKIELKFLHKKSHCILIEINSNNIYLIQDEINKSI